MAPGPLPATPARLRIAVSGGSGLIGSALLPALREQGHTAIRLVRGTADGEDATWWDPASGAVDAERLGALDVVVHLAGESVGRRWTAHRRRRIRESRVDATARLAEHLARLATPPRVFISASAVGLYGDRGDEVLDEDSAPGAGFLAEVVRAWEAAAAPLDAVGARVVHLRFGIVLSTRGGALARMLPPFRLGLGGPLGGGGQWMSWVAMPDVLGAIGFALHDARLTGAVNVTAPGPATNRVFARTLGRLLGRPAALRVPAAVLRLIFGQMAEETILTSQRVLPRRLQEAGYRFRFPTLEEALRDALGERRFT